MIYRFMFAAYSTDPRKVELVEGTADYCALAFDENRVYLYVESNDSAVQPENLVRGEFIQYPNGKEWERTSEIFHYSVPVSQEQWRRKVDKTPRIRLNRLKPEKIASYIFYHFQLQEENLGWNDRYGNIYLWGDVLIFYDELPQEDETEKMQGQLTTQNSPKKIWAELMNEHFQERWRPIEILQQNQYIEY